MSARVLAAMFGVGTFSPEGAARRGVDPWGSEDFAELTDELERRGYDASGVRHFSN